MQKNVAFTPNPASASSTRGVDASVGPSSNVNAYRPADRAASPRYTTGPQNEQFGAIVAYVAAPSATHVATAGTATVLRLRTLIGTKAFLFPARLSLHVERVPRFKHIQHLPGP